MTKTWTDLGEAIVRFESGERTVRARSDGDARQRAAAEAFNRIADIVAAADEDAREIRTALAERQSDLLALQRRLGQAERFAALGALAAKLAHELGTPLHSVAGHLDLMMRDPELPPSVRERADIIAGEVDRLAGMIRGHLRRLRSPAPRPRPTALNDLVTRIVNVVRPLLGARSITIDLDLAAEAAAPFDCDPGQVEQVVMNLLQNAIDALPRGGGITMCTTATEHGRSISVTDNGRGVAPEHLERVFEPFFTTKAPGRGTGLGLALCREIARNHGGDIVLDSEAGLGTVVTMTLGEARP